MPIIVVTQDEHFLDRFDRSVHLRDGRLDRVEASWPRAAMAIVRGLPDTQGPRVRLATARLPARKPGLEVHQRLAGADQAEEIA